MKISIRLESNTSNDEDTLNEDTLHCLIDEEDSRTISCSLKVESNITKKQLLFKCNELIQILLSHKGVN